MQGIIVLIFFVFKKMALHVIREYAFFVMYIFRFAKEFFQKYFQIQ